MPESEADFSWMCNLDMPCEDCEQGDHDHCYNPTVIRETPVHIYKHCGCEEEVHYKKGVGHG